MNEPAFGFASVESGGEQVLAVLSGSDVVVLSDLLGDAPSDFEALIAAWDSTVDRVLSALGTADGVERLPAQQAGFGVPTVARPSVWCAGANYADHIAEMGEVTVERAFHFLVPPSSLNAHCAAVQRPLGVEKLDWEVELAAVIGREARDVSVASALDSVIGYTVANDVSVRDESLMRHPIFGIDWVATKSADALTVVGPAVIPSRFVEEPQNLALRLSVNGEMRQDSNTDQMVISIAEQIAALSRWVTLSPGDLLLTGTPAGTAAAHGTHLSDGDVMVAEVEGVGRLVNTIFV